MNGSYAAGLMSYSAAANGGGVKPGSFVAHLQSIGSNGLGTVATVALLTVAFAGAGAVGLCYGLTYGAVTGGVVAAAAVIP